jgi:hypothetical protein
LNSHFKILFCFRSHRPIGQSFLPLLNSLTGSRVEQIPFTSGSSNRPPSPSTVQLEKAIEEARRDSLKLEERRNTILEKVEKLEKKKAKKQKNKTSESPNKSEMADEASAAAAADVEETPKAPREPPIVFKGVLLFLSF